MSVTQARKELVSQKTRYAEASDAAVKNRSLRTQVLEFLSPLDVEADAQAVADNILAFRKPRRHVVEIPVVGQQFKREIGETITLDIPDFNPSSGDGIIIGIQEDIERDLTILTVVV